MARKLDPMRGQRQIAPVQATSVPVLRVLHALRRPQRMIIRSTRSLMAAGMLVGCAILFAGYLYASRFVPNNSDNASMILEAQAMLHGNIILHGWYLPPDSFITSEMPLDALSGLVFTSEQLLKTTPALLYASTVLGAVYLAGRCVLDPAARWFAAI